MTAACVGLPVAMFFPEEGESARNAKQVCATCLVRQDCLDEAMARDERHGVWGGLTVRERDRITNQQEPRRRRTVQPWTDIARGPAMPTRSPNTISQRAKYGPDYIAALLDLLTAANRRAEQRGHTLPPKDLAS